MEVGGKGREKIKKYLKRARDGKDTTSFIKSLSDEVLRRIFDFALSNAGLSPEGCKTTLQQLLQQSTAVTTAAGQAVDVLQPYQPIAPVGAQSHRTVDTAQLYQPDVPIAPQPPMISHLPPQTSASNIGGSIDPPSTRARPALQEVDANIPSHPAGKDSLKRKRADIESDPEPTETIGETIVIQGITDRQAYYAVGTFLDSARAKRFRCPGIAVHENCSLS